MSDFKAKMHQIRFPLGLRPIPSLQRSPDPLAVFKGPTSKGREGKGGEKKRRGREREEEGREGKEGRIGPQLGSLDPPVYSPVNILYMRDVLSC